MSKKLIFADSFAPLYVAFGCLFLVANWKLVYCDAESKLPSNSDKNLITNCDVTTRNPVSLKIVSRAEWLANPPNSNLLDLELPVKRVVIAHTATDGCSNQAECIFRIRFIQLFHMDSRGWDDIGYNFIIGGDSSVYIGRDWNKMGTHTKGYNQDSISIAFIGNYSSIDPTEKQLLATQRLLEVGIENGKLHPNYRLFGHRQLMPTESPGNKLYEIIKTWPHWSNNTEIDF